MTKHIPRTVSLGDLILTVFDKAAQYRLAPTELSRLVKQTVDHMLLRRRNFNQPSTVLTWAPLG